MNANAIKWEIIDFPEFSEKNENEKRRKANTVSDLIRNEVNNTLAYLFGCEWFFSVLEKCNTGETHISTKNKWFIEKNILKLKFQQQIEFNLVTVYDQDYWNI